MMGTHVLPDGSVRFLYHDGSTHQAAVAGSFSDWQPVGMSPQGDGWWEIEIGPLHGNVFYKFVTPEGWHLDSFNYRKSQDGGSSFLNAEGACGQVIRRAFYSSALGKSKSYCAYLPPAYAKQQWRSFPVLFLMGGLFEEETGWVDRGSVDEKLDELILSGTVDDFIVVMPAKDDAVFHEELWNSYMSFLAHDLPRHVESEYRTLPVRGSEGLSIGGGWAIRLGAILPEQFCSVSGLSANFDGEFYELVQANQTRIRHSGARFRIACGSGEGPVIQNNSEFSEFLHRLEISNEFHVNEGPHDWELWGAQIGHSFQFHDHSFKQKLGG